MRWQGFAVGFIGLVALEALVSNSNGVAAFGGIASGVGRLAEKVISPLVPAFTTKAATSAATSSTATSPAAQVPPAPGPTLAPLPATTTATTPTYVGPYPTA